MSRGNPVRTCVLALAIATAALSIATGANATSSTTSTTARASTTPVSAGSVYTAVTPQRLLDTRTASGFEHGPIQPNNGFSVNMPSTVPADATAVVLNVTALDSTAPTFLRIAPARAQLTDVSTVNVAPGETRANLATVALSTGIDPPAVELQVGNAALDAVIDLEGYYTPEGDPGSQYTPVPPDRVLDTRSNLGITGNFGAQTTKTLDLSSVLPADATAVTFNLTATDATADTFVEAFGADANQPTTSNLNVSAGATTPNLVTVAVGPDREVDLFNANGNVDLIADLAGYYATSSTQAFFPVIPLRVLDTRDAGGAPREPITSGGTRAVGLGNWLPATATAAVFNLTGTNVTGNTFLIASPTGQSRPTASNLNLVPGQTSANLAIVALGTGGSVTLFNHVGQTDAIVDLTGYFAPPIAPCTSDCVFSFGENTNGERGIGTTDEDPHAVNLVYGLSGVTRVAGIFGNAYALRSDGTVWAWGDNGFGELGNGKGGQSDDPTAPTDFYSTVPVQVSGLTGVVAIAPSMALKSDGTVWTWGLNNAAQLGDGDITDNQSDTPVKVSGLTNVTAIASDGQTMFALRSDGTVWAWGSNMVGALGIGSIGENNPNCDNDNGTINLHVAGCTSAVPVEVSGLTGVTAIAPEAAAKSDGTVWRWGALPTNVGQNATPVQVSGVSNVTALGENEGGSTYALRSDGTVEAYGLNEFGSLGDGVDCGADPCPDESPVTVSGLSDVTAVAGAGGFTGYALKSDGTVWGWGGRQATLGDGNEFDQSDVPIQIQGLAGATAIGNDGYVVVPNP